MSNIDAKEAASYNARVAGKLWKQDELPGPLALGMMFPVDSEAFAHLVSASQIHLGVVVDGKLGTDTLGALRAWAMTLQGAPPVPSEEGEDDEEGLVQPSKTVIVPPARVGVSNKIRIGKKSVPLPQKFLDAGITASNFVDDDEHHFAYSYKRAQPLRWFVHHESVSMSAKSTIRTLENKQKRSARKGKNGGRGYPYGIHLIGAPDGHISCHADLLEVVLVHANYFNRHCCGIEWVNPYNPKWARAPFTETIPKQWWTWVPKDAKPLYTLPTPAQLRAAVLLSEWLPEVLPALELDFPTRALSRSKRRISGWQDNRLPDRSGIVAHQDFSSHADGRYILEHVIEELDA